MVHPLNNHNRAKCCVLLKMRQFLAQLLAGGARLGAVRAIVLVAGRPHRHRRQAHPQEGRRPVPLKGHEGRQHHGELRGGGRKEAENRSGMEDFKPCFV